MSQFLRYNWISLLIPLPFIILKLTSTTLRLSDTNVYFYTAYKLLEGQILYNDIFFTNFPVFPYLSSLYLLVSSNNLNFYYFSAVLEIALTSVFIYAVVYKQWKRRLYALSSQVIYLFSFIVLATSDHQSGVFSASLFTVLSYFFFQRNKYFLTGIFTAVAILTKAYFLPIALTYGCFLLLKQKKHLYKFIVGGITASILILSPFLIFAREGLIDNVFLYSLTRGAGTSKFEVFQFFIFRDLILFALLITNLLLFRKYLLFSLFSAFSLIFIILYQDIYYLYLNFTVPFLVVSLPIYFSAIEKKLSLQKMVIPSLIGVIIIINLWIYISSFRSLQTLQQKELLVRQVRSQHANYIYGSNDIAPALAFLSDTPLLNDTIDTNANIFRKGILSAEEMTNQAIAKKALVVVHGVSFPQYKIEDTVLDEIVVREIIQERCTLAYSHPIYAEGVANRLNFFRCFE